MPNVRRGSEDGGKYQSTCSCSHKEMGGDGGGMHFPYLYDSGLDQSLELSLC